MIPRKVKIYPLSEFLNYFKNLPADSSMTWSEELEKYINNKLAELGNVRNHRKWAFVQIDDNYMYFQGDVLGEHPGAVDI